MSCGISWFSFGDVLGKIIFVNFAILLYPICLVVLTGDWKEDFRRVIYCCHNSILYIVPWVSWQAFLCFHRAMPQDSRRGT